MRIYLNRNFIEVNKEVIDNEEEKIRYKLTKNEHNEKSNPKKQFNGN